MTHDLFEQLCEEVLRYKSSYGSRITEDELYQKVISTKFTDIHSLGIWLSPDRDMYLVYWHEPFIKDIMKSKYKMDKSLMKQLQDDFYVFAFERGWVRINITMTGITANGCQDRLNSVNEYLRSLAKQLDRTLFVDAEC